MGANAVRVYGVQKNYNYHGELWDMLHAANITVMAGFDIYGQFLADRGVMERVKYELRETLKANHHPAIGMWAIGNELNGAWNGWVGDPGDCAGPCLFGGDVALLYSSIDELCQVVVEWGKLCTTVLADVPVPRSVTLRTWTDDPCDRLLPETAGLTAAEAARAELTELGVAPDAACDAVTHCALLDCLWAGYLSERSCPRFGNDYYGDATDDGTFRFGCCCGAPVAHDGVTRWVEVVEQAANLTGIGAWAANVYRGFTFGPLFQTYAASSGKPFVVGEYGIDAYDMTTRRREWRPAERVGAAADARARGERRELRRRLRVGGGGGRVRDVVERRVAQGPRHCAGVRDGRDGRDEPAVCGRRDRRLPVGLVARAVRPLLAAGLRAPRLPGL